MAAQKKRAAPKVAAKKVAARRSRAVSNPAPETVEEASTENPFHISSRMTPKQRLLVIDRATERWEDFIQLPIRQLTEGELELIIQLELERSVPRWAVAKRAHSAYGVIRNARERNDLEARVKKAIQEANDNG